MVRLLDEGIFLRSLKELADPGGDVVQLGFTVNPGKVGRQAPEAK
jgi:hypothetical protein